MRNLLEAAAELRRMAHEASDPHVRYWLLRAEHEILKEYLNRKL